MDDMVDFSVTVRRQATAEAPAAVEVQLTNLASVGRNFQFTPVVPFTPERVNHVDGAGRLSLIPHSRGETTEYSTLDVTGDGEFELISYDPEAGCWRATESNAYVDYFGAVQLGHCERTARAYSVVAAQDNNGCLPDGTYRTSTTWFIGDAENAKTWGFTITIGES